MDDMFEETVLPGVFLIRNRMIGDQRGGFCKIFHSGMFARKGLHTEWREHYFSISAQNVIRGMHFQLPPMDHDKLVYVPCGAVLDVALDLRSSSPAFGKCFAHVLSAENHLSVYIPQGCAHGFKSLADHTITAYLTGSLYSPEHDTGILYDSFGFDWECASPVLSARDTTFCTFADFAQKGIF